MSPMATVTSSSEALVMEITDMLETDPVASEQWKAFTDQACQGNRGPSLQGAAVLEIFVCSSTGRSAGYSARRQKLGRSFRVQPQG